MDKSEYERLERMYVYERGLFEEGCASIAGVDEVGRGSLAGPVVACAVILPKDCFIENVNDSKKLSSKKRVDLTSLIKERAADIAFGMVMPAEIDAINILNASLKAMEMAVDSLKMKPDAVLADGNRGLTFNGRNLSIVKGDQKSLSIASASIIAKVFRDSLMRAYDKLFPGYDLSQNKGYGVKKHIEAIKAIGHCPIHRMSFLKNILNKNENGNDE
ncbi:MAG: ribonuclease HII [Clostridiales bacterium]|jgi:ribonuclease HII|nr:ribonuclease HII [Clostridiales bacterium]